MKSDTVKDFGRANVVVIGGGTGSFTVLSALKQENSHISAIVSMADDGGSTGVLRDELGVLPPGDVRQCLVALAESSVVRELFNYRFEEGSFQGHSFGNLFLTTLEKTSGSFSKAVELASQILRIKGKVIPATLDDVRLKMEWSDESVVLHGEKIIDAKAFDHDPRQAVLSLEPSATLNQHAKEAIEAADLVIVAPGDMYTSLGALLVVDGIGDALRHTMARVLYICNLVTKEGQTDNFSVEDHVCELERLAGGAFIDAVLYNNQDPDGEVAKRYARERAEIVHPDGSAINAKLFGAALLGEIDKKDKSDILPVTRSYIRHDSVVLSKEIVKFYNINNEH